MHPIDPKKDKERQEMMQRLDIIEQLRKDIFGNETTVPGGYIISNAFWGFWPKDSERYINPKMEDELFIFRKKIETRFQQKQISTNFAFPRVGSALHQTIRAKHQGTHSSANLKQRVQMQ
jgi:citrate lyase synthetase